MEIQNLEKQIELATKLKKSTEIIDALNEKLFNLLTEANSNINMIKSRSKDVGVVHVYEEDKSLDDDDISLLST